MRRRRILVVLALAAVAAGVLLCWPRGPKEPVYQGKKLSYWIREAIGQPDAGTKKKATKEGRTAWATNRLPYERTEAGLKAIRAIGTNAVPWLMAKFTQPLPQWRFKFNIWARRVGLRGLQFSDNFYQINEAAYVLQVLGPDAAPALPALSEYLGDSRRSYKAVEVMSFCGEAALPYYLKAVASTNFGAAMAAVGGMGEMARKSETPIAPLLQILQHTNEWMRLEATRALGKATSRLDLTVPVLTKCLINPNRFVQMSAVLALAELTNQAKAAIPELQRLTKNPEPSVAQAASNALMRIDPAAEPSPRP